MIPPNVRGPARRFYEKLDYPGAALAIASCGGGGEKDCSAIEAAAEAAFDDFTTILENDDVQACFPPAPAPNCDCPNGGSITVNQATLTLTFNDCTSATDQVYNGTFTVSQDVTTFSASMPEFDGCTNLIATDVVTTPGSCSGTISATCGGQTITCTMVEGEDECIPDDCTC